MRVAITGYTGNIGSRLCEILSSQNIDVIKIGRRPCSNYKFDLFDPPTTIEKAPFVDCFVHLAWFTTHPDFWDSPLNEKLVTTSISLLQAFSRTNPNIHVVVAGSCAELFSNSNQNNELGNAKSRLRILLTEQQKCAITWFQIFFAYGPGEPSTKVLTIIKNGKHLSHKINNPTSIRDFIHFDQIATAFSQAILSRKLGCYQLGNGVGFTIYDLMQFRLNGKIPKQYTFNDSHNYEDLKIADPNKNWFRSINTSILLNWLNKTN